MGKREERTGEGIAVIMAVEKYGEAGCSRARQHQCLRLTDTIILASSAQFHELVFRVLVSLKSAVVEYQISME